MPVIVEEEETHSKSPNPILKHEVHVNGNASKHSCPYGNHGNSIDTRGKSPSVGSDEGVVSSLSGRTSTEGLSSTMSDTGNVSIDTENESVQTGNVSIDTENESVQTGSVSIDTENESVQTGNESVLNKIQSKKEGSDVVSKSDSKLDKEDKEDEFVTLSLNLILPGASEPLEVMHIAKDTVNDLLQYAFERPECCYRTCLSVQMNGKTLDSFAELGSVENLRSGSTLVLVEVPYTLRDVLLHVQRLQELLGSNPLQQSITCTNGLSLSMLSAVIMADLENDNTDSIDSSGLDTPVYCIPPDPSIDPSTHSFISSPDLLAFYPEGLERNSQTPECIKSLSYSPWNPPTPNRKFKGDILYMDVITMEGDEYCVTATPSGFFLNRSIPGTKFDTHPRKIAHHSQHLVTLLQQISPLFRKNFILLQKYGETKNVFEVFPIPYPVYPWVAPKQETKPITFRIDDNMGLKAATDEILVGQLRDWNEEIQTTRELPVTSLQHRVFRDRALFKAHSDFVQAAVRGGMAAVDGHLHPLNPAEADRHHMYLWNNIFFSTGFDGRGHFKEFGGDEAGHAAANYDLQGVSIMEKVNVEGLHTLGAVLVDYRGFRVFSQSIIPGLLQKEHASSIEYGSMDNGKTISMNDKFHELMKQCSTKLNLRSHKLSTEAGEDFDIPVSVEVKGIKGTDGRHYVLDLFRILPPDANYNDPGLVTGENTDDDECRPSAEDLGLRHKLYIMRPELLENYIRSITLQLHVMKMQKDIMEGEEEKAKEREKTNENNSPDDHPVNEGSNNMEEDLPENENKSLRKEEQDVIEKEEEVVKKTEEVVKVKEEYGGEINVEKKKELEKEITNALSRSNEEPVKSKENVLKKDVLQEILSVSQSTFGSKIPQVKSLPIISSENSTMLLVTEDEEDVTIRAGGSDLMDILLMEGLELTDEKEYRGLSVNEDSLSPLVSYPNLSSDSIKGMTSSESLDGSEPYSLLDLYPDLNVRLNADIFTPGLHNADSADEIIKDRKRVVHLSLFLTSYVIPRFLRDCLYLSTMPLDGAAMKSQMHSRGINMRYLGRIALSSSSRQDLEHIHRLCISEMILRTARRKFHKILVNTPLHRTAAAISHFLNCLLNEAEDSGSETSTASHKKRHKKRKGSGKEGSNKSSTLNKDIFSSLTQSSLWSYIKEDIQFHYRYTLDYPTLTQVCLEFGLQKISLLREFCLKTGIQVLLKEYKFSSSTPFTDDDIIALVPVIKHTQFRPMEATGLYDLAYSRLNAGNVKFAHDLLMEAIQLCVQVYGPMHTDIANCYRLLARIHHMMGEPLMALSYQHKATLMYERLSGVDHFTTISAYFNLAQYCLQANKTVIALRLFYRVKYLTLLVHGGDHPEIANVDFQISLCHCNLKDYNKALTFLHNTIVVQLKYHGRQSISIAITHTLTAHALSELGEFREAITHEKAAYSIYNTKLGPDHDKTKKSSECLRQLTERAVFVQKQIKMVTDSQTGLVAAAQIPGSWWDVLTKHAEYTQSRQSHKNQRSTTRNITGRRKNKPINPSNT